MIPKLVCFFVRHRFVYAYSKTFERLVIVVRCERCGAKP